MKSGRMLRAMEHVDPDLIDEAASYKGAKKKNTWLKWGAIAACLCIVAVGVIAILPGNTHDAGSGVAGGKAVAGGSAVGMNEGSMYSVAVFPADRDRDDVQDAYCEEIHEAEAKNEAGLGDYLPSELPDGFHFDTASIYVTTMKDGAVYKRLLVTYRTGEGAKPLPEEAGAVLVPGGNELGEEFRINVFSFRPDTRAAVYSAEEARREVTDGNTGNGFFYVQYGDHYVGIEPLSLSAEEIIGLIDSIGG